MSYSRSFVSDKGTVFLLNTKTRLYSLQFTSYTEPGIKFDPYENKTGSKGPNEWK